MLKYRKKPVIIEAEAYRLGLEDGFDTIDDVPIDKTLTKLQARKGHT